MTQLSLAYSAAFFLIAILLLFARKNRKEGWRKPQVPLYAEKAELSGEPGDHPGDHLGELARLNQSLVRYGSTTKPEPAKKPVVLA
jgi:hypothetical protein